MRERGNFDYELVVCLDDNVHKKRLPDYISAYREKNHNSSLVLVKHAPSAKNPQNSLTPVTLNLYMCCCLARRQLE